MKWDKEDRKGIEGVLEEIVVKQMIKENEKKKK